MLNTSTIGQINRALENSFAAIKRDMNELKLAAASQAELSAQSRRDLEALREDAVTKDKLNVLKIKIGEVNDELKRIWDLEKNLQNVSASFGNLKSLRASMDDLNGKLISLNMKITDINKQAVTETQLKALVSELNGELNRLAGDIRKVEAEREVINQKMLDKHSEKMMGRIESVRSEVTAARKETREFVNKEEVQRVLAEINKDFDSLKKELSTHSSDHKAYVKEDEVKSLLKTINKEFDGVASELSDIRKKLEEDVSSVKKQQKQYLTPNDIKALITDISDEFSDVRAELAAMNKDKSQKYIDDLRKSVTDVKQDVRKLQSNIVTKKEMRDIEHKATPVATKDFKPKYAAARHNKTYRTGNFMIFFAFVALIVSIISFYLGNQPLMDNSAIGAVIIFVIGIFLRIVAVLKSR